MSESSGSGYIDDRKSQSYSNNYIHSCKICKQFVSMCSMEEHMAFKHGHNQSESELNNAMENRPLDLQSFMSKSFQKLSCNASVYSNNTVGQHDRRKISSIEVREIFKSDFREPNVNAIQSSQKIRETAKPLPMPRAARSPTRGANMFAEKKQLANRLIAKFTNGNAMLKSRDPNLNHEKRKIPTVFEMFNIPRPQSPGRVHNGDGGKMHRRSLSAVKKSVSIPENNVQCQMCLNIMHKDYYEGHIQRKHSEQNVSNDAADGNGIPHGNGVSNGNDHMNGLQCDDSPPIGHQKCHICSNIMPKEHIENHVQRTHPNTAFNDVNNEANFTRCRFCTAYMHIDYMPCHLMRKHKTDCTKTGSIGVLWSQYTDEQVNFWLNDYMVFAKNGAFYMTQRSKPPGC